MVKLRLRFPEGFTEHATALINHIHSQPTTKPPRSFEARVQQVKDSIQVVKALEEAQALSIPKDTLR